MAETDRLTARDLESMAKEITMLRTIYIDILKLRGDRNDLMAALVGCVDALEYVDRNAPDLTGYGVRMERVSAARAAIAKAEGRS